MAPPTPAVATVVSVKKVAGRIVQAVLQGPTLYVPGGGMAAILPCAGIDSVVGVDASNGDLVTSFHGNAPAYMPNQIVLRAFVYGMGFVEEGAVDLSGVFYTVTYTKGPAQKPYTPPLPPP